MVAIGIILVSVIGVFTLGFAEDLDSSPPSVGLDTVIGDSEVTIRHASGDVLDPRDVEVVMVGPDATIRYPLENLRGDASSDFEAGDVFRLSHGVSSGDVEVRVVHEPSNSIIERSIRRITDGIISLAVLDDQVASNEYAGSQTDGGSTTITDGGRTVKLDGNQWRFLEYPYDITPETMLTFEFKSTAEGDIHGIGLEQSDTGQDSDRIVQLYGTQKWGVNVSEATTEPYYQQSDDWRRYTIPIGEIYADRDGTFQADAIAFVMDCDPNGPSGSRDGCKSQEDGEATATAYFRNVEVSERDER